MEIRRPRYQLHFYQKPLYTEWFQITKFMGPTWAHMGPVGPRWAHVGPINLAIRGSYQNETGSLWHVICTKMTHCHLGPDVWVWCHYKRDINKYIKSTLKTIVFNLLKWWGIPQLWRMHPWLMFSNVNWISTPISRFMGPTWGPSGADRT